MEAVLISFVMRGITEITKRTRLKPQAVIAILCLVFGGGYYYLNRTNPETVKETIKFVWTAFWISQWFYIFLSKKTWIEK